MVCEADELLAQFCQLCLDEGKASREVQQRPLHTKNQTAFEEQVDPLICEQGKTVRREKANNLQGETLPPALLTSKLNELRTDPPTHLEIRTSVLFGKGPSS